MTSGLVPHDLVTRDLELVQHRGQDEGGDVLHHLVTHALPLAHGEGLEVFGLLESVILLDEPLRVVTLGCVPKLLTEVHVVIVDKDDSVCVNFVSFNEKATSAKSSRIGLLFLVLNIAFTVPYVEV